MPTIVEQLLAGFTLALAQVISQVENESPQAPGLLDALYPYSGTAYRLGITGPPGAGKSTLVDQLTRLYRKAGLKVGIMGVDPTSPFTGGALLGDRRDALDAGLGTVPPYKLARIILDKS